MVRRCPYTITLSGAMNAEAEILMDMAISLQANLGGSLKRHLSDLDKHSDQEDIREALHCALYETRTLGEQLLSAREVWVDFAAKAGPGLAGVADYKDLQDSVAEVLNYEAVLADPDIIIDRQELKADFAAVSDAIRDLVIELRS